MRAPRPRRAVLALCLALIPAMAHAADAPASSDVAPPDILFEIHCGICHDQMGTGTMMLGRRLGGDHALLARRTDLTADYIRHVVRNGLNSMPPQTRVDVSDDELNRIAAYLTRPAAERPPPPGRRP